MKRELIKCAKALYKQGRKEDAKAVWKIAKDIDKKKVNELKKLLRLKSFLASNHY